MTKEKILKCTSRIILGADHAADKVFKNTEQKIGVQKLLNVAAGEKCSPLSVKVYTSWP